MELKVFRKEDSLFATTGEKFKDVYLLKIGVQKNDQVGRELAMERLNNIPYFIS